MAFSKQDLINIFDKHNIQYNLQTFNTNTGYKIEHVFLLQK
jgi:hypothetical protein